MNTKMFERAALAQPATQHLKCPDHQDGCHRWDERGLCMGGTCTEVSVKAQSTPQPRQRLTDEQIAAEAVKAWPNLPEHWFKDEWRWSAAWKAVSKFARAIEAAHGITGGQA